MTSPPSPSSDAPAEITVQVNGDARTVQAGASIETVVDALGLAGRKLAIAVNRTVVPRSHYHDHVLSAGDRVEILEAVGGG